MAQIRVKFQARILRRTMPARPIKPVPSKPSVPGSGTGAMLTVVFPLAKPSVHVPRRQAAAVFCPLVIVRLVGIIWPFQVSVPVATAPKMYVFFPPKETTVQLPEVKVPLKT